jgi:rubrerythrin
MTDKPTDTGFNRTGIAMSPIDSKRMVEAAEEVTAGGHANRQALENERVRWAANAGPVGTVPPPGTVKGLAKAVLERLQGHKLTVLTDKLGERLAFERTGTRLYDALIAKLEAANVHQGGPTRAELENIREKEHQHFLLVRDAIQQIGADPTAITPSADVVSVAGLGWVQALTDPRTTLTECLNVMLVVERGDVDGWELLIEMATGLGLDDLAQRFCDASAVEQEHAVKVRGWLATAVLGQVGVQPQPPREVHNTAHS